MVNLDENQHYFYKLFIYVSLSFHLVYVLQSKKTQEILSKIISKERLDALALGILIGFGIGLLVLTYAFYLLLTKIFPQGTAEISRQFTEFTVLGFLSTLIGITGEVYKRSKIRSRLKTLIPKRIRLES